MKILKELGVWGVCLLFSAIGVIVLSQLIGLNPELYCDGVFCPEARLPVLIYLGTACVLGTPVLRLLWKID